MTVTVDKRFSQGEFINSYPDILNAEGVCSGFNIEITRWVLKHIAKGKAEDKIDVIAKLRRALSKNDVDNFAKRLALYQSEQMDQSSPATKMEYEKKNFLGSLPEEMKDKKFIGFSFDTFDEEGGALGAHTINIRRIGDSESYEVIDVNLGSRKCKNKDALNSHIEDILDHYNNTNNRDDHGISVYDIEDIVRKRDLLPEPILENDPDKELKKTKNKNKKYKLDGSILLALDSESPGGFIQALIENADAENINYQDENGQTALMIAILEGKSDIARSLIEKGADLNLQDIMKNNIIMYAVSEGNIEITQLLIEKGADLNSLYREDKQTPLIYAVDQGNIEMAQLLIEKGADLNMQDVDGHNALIYAIDNGNIEMTKLLIEKGADLNARDESGRSALMHAFEYGRIDIAKMLIEKDVELNFYDNKGRTVLMYAMDRGRIDLAQSLIDKGADLEMKNKRGYTALGYAWASYNEKFIPLLEAAKASASARSFIDGGVSGTSSALSPAPAVGSGIMPSRIPNRVR